MNFVQKFRMERRLSGAPRDTSLKPLASPAASSPSSATDRIRPHFKSSCFISFLHMTGPQFIKLHLARTRWLFLHGLVRKTFFGRQHRCIPVHSVTQNGSGEVVMLVLRHGSIYPYSGKLVLLPCSG
jgi:hypothetical protein